MTSKELDKLIEKEKLRKEAEPIRLELRQVILKIKHERKNAEGNRINYWDIADYLEVDNSRITRILHWVPMQLDLLKIYLKKLRQFERNLR